MLILRFLIFLGYHGAVLSPSIQHIEGDECLCESGELGICKNAFNCQWIRTAQIHEDYWTYCESETSPYLICCLDPISTLDHKLSCERDTEEIFSPSTLEECLKNNQTLSELSALTISYTDEQCQALNEQYKDRLNKSFLILGIANGEDASHGEFPFMAVFVADFRCGGTIITKRHVLTAAHCVLQRIYFSLQEFVRTVKIRVGSIFFNKNYQEIGLTKAVVHESYNNTGGGFDIAILHLAEDINFTIYAFPACLFHGEKSLEENSTATIIGFGLIASRKKQSDVLQKAIVNIGGPQHCTKEVFNKRTFKGLREDQICAVDFQIKSDTCQGDSGGPIIQKFNQNEWQTVIGITSFGENFCTATRKPSVYTRLVKDYRSNKMHFYLKFLFFLGYHGFLLSFSHHLTEGDECLVATGHVGNCKSAFDCQWIRDEQISEHFWTFCDCDQSNYLICCRDAAFYNKTLACDSPETKNIFSEGTLRECHKRRNKNKPIKRHFAFDAISYTDEQCKLLEEEYAKIVEASPVIHGIAHGIDAERGEFPFMAVLLKYEDGNYTRQCGGTIITKRHILTAAHCIWYRDTSEFVRTAKIRVGSIYFDEGYQELGLSGVIPHEKYQNTGSGNDIALLFLSSDIDISLDSYPACLHNAQKSLEENSTVTVVGFGETHDTNEPIVLQKAEINVLNPQKCSKEVIFKLGFDGLRKEQICAGDLDIKSDTCKGDSGGPLIQIDKNDRKIVVGLTSFGPAFCDSNKVPGVYTRISPYLAWIEENVKKQDYVTHAQLSRN
ncbi:uncharacterized protein LOC134833327 [Culicoides brevitarsis]|uniref:uncharacterized protein LOC134833327 n=1 Tax=Culicoides brevitarsis TaxID=469753 RepID=UPI00307B37A6